MDTIPHGLVFVRITVVLEEEADEDFLRVEIERAKEEVFNRFIGCNPSPETLNALHREIGHSIRNLPGVKQVRVTTPLTANPYNLVVEGDVNSRYG